MTTSFLTTLLLVGLGGFFGSALRYVTGEWVQGLFGPSTFPYGTLFVNALGCLTIGFLAGLSDSRDLFGDSARLFLFVGLLGGFTTFSAFGHQTFTLLRDGQTAMALANTGLQLSLCLGAIAIGYFAFRNL